MSGLMYVFFPFFHCVKHLTSYRGTLWRRHKNEDTTSVQFNVNVSNSQRSYLGWKVDHWNQIIKPLGNLLKGFCFHRLKDKTPLIAGITKSQTSKLGKPILFFSSPCLALDIVRQETQCFLCRAEEPQGLGMRFIMAATLGDNAEQERFDLKLTWIAPVAKAFSQPTGLE